MASLNPIKPLLPKFGKLSIPALCLGFLGAQLTDLPAANQVAEGEVAANLAFTDPAIMTSFEGVLESVADGPVGTILIKINRRGGFTAKIQSLDLRASGRGGIDAETGEGTGEVRVGWRRILPIQFQVSESATTPGRFELDGEILSAVDGAANYTFAAKAAAYTRRDTPAEAGQYSMGLLGATDGVGTVPLGDGTGAVKVSSGGRVSFSGYHSDGSRYRSRATILDGGSVVFYATVGRNGVAVGELVFQEIEDVSDFNGDVNYRKDYTARGLYPAAYTFTTNAVGNRWIPGMDPRAAMGLSNGVNNAVIRLTGGPLDGQDAYCTIDYRGRITVPRTQTLRLSGRVGLRDGMVMCSYQYFDPESVPAYSVNTRARLYAAVLPEFGETHGLYVAGTGGGAFEIIPNDDGELPPFTAVNPIIRPVSEFGGGHEVQVTASEPWDVIIPDNAFNWVSADVVGGDGDGVVTFQVSQNNAYQDRYAYISIAGQLHLISQYGSSNPSNVVTINPEEMTIGILGGSYFVSIDAVSPNAIPPTSFFSVVDWVVVLPFYHPVTGILEGANIIVAEPTGDIFVGDPSAILRSAEVLVAGQPHLVNQVFGIVTDGGVIEPAPEDP